MTNHSRKDHHIAIASGIVLGGMNLLLAITFGLDEFVLIKLDLVLACVLLFILAGQVNQQKKRNRQFTSTIETRKPQPRHSIQWPWNRSRMQRQAHQAASRKDTLMPQTVVPKQHIEDCYNRIALLMNRKGILGQAVATSGPFAIRFSIMLLDPFQVDEVLKLGRSIRNVLRTKARIVEDDGELVIEVQLPKHYQRTPPVEKLIGRGSAIAVGIDGKTKIVHTKLETHGAFYWIGAPGFGKTEAMKSFLFLALYQQPNTRFFVCATQQKINDDWAAFGSARGCLGLIGDYAEMEQAIGWAAQQMNAGLDYKLMVVVDDLTTLTEHIDVTSELDQIALNGRGANCHLMVGTHGAGSMASAGVKKGKLAMTFRVLFGSADNVEAARSSGQKNDKTGIDQLSGQPGDAILITPRGIVRLATPRIDDFLIGRLPMGDGQPRPWVKVSALPATTIRTAETTAKRSAAIRSGSAADPQFRSGFRSSAVDDRCVETTNVAGASAATHPRTMTAASEATADWDALRLQIVRRLPDAFPIRPARSLAADEAELVLYLQEEGFSQNELCWAVFTDCTKPVKNAGSGARREYIKDALALAGGEAPDDDQSAPHDETPSALPADLDEIDLSTSEGRALFEQLQKSGTRFTILDD